MSDVKVITAADPAALAPFDMIIDVRSPSEFAEDHAPGAVNLPVLDDAERAQVGTIYVQDSRFRARRIGAALVARNVARHLETALADRPGEFQPLIYCWRGGQRSGAMAAILSQVGWRTALLAGGYRTYRRHVKERLYESDLGLTVVLLDGRTGCGKTQMLPRLAARGAQVLDLEELAQHRGSVFGARPGVPQPSQKMFESRLLAALEKLDPARPVVMEAEASKVGDRMIPPALWKLMAAAPRIGLSAPFDDRVRYIARDYAHAADDPAGLEAALVRLPIHPGRKTVVAWQALAQAGDLAAVAADLMRIHYDPAYDRSSLRDDRVRLGEVALTGLDDAAQEVGADALMAILNSH